MLYSCMMNFDMALSTTCDVLVLGDPMYGIPRVSSNALYFGLHNKIGEAL